ncbi:MAG: DUF4340 domain-containing protein [Gemmatimonadetes bacterium]|nr:DUF4340 domain-containing protein [Gemmatimonadota bacterium]
MNPKQLQRIAIALVVLLILWGLAEIFGTGSDTTAARFDLPKLTPADVDTVKIFRATDTLMLVKRADTWSVNGHLASSQAVTDLFNGLKDTSRAELVAQSPTSHAQLGVDSSSGKRLELIKGGQLLAGVIVGGRGPGWQGMYARRPGENQVYLIGADLGNVVERQLDDWRDKLVAAVEPDSVREVRVQLGRGGYALRRDDAGWRFATGARADSGAVRRMLEQYRTLQAGGFPTLAQADSLDFRRPNWRLTLVGRSTPLAGLLFDSTASWWYVQRAEGGTVYRVESWRLPQLFPADSSLRAKPDSAGK